MVKERCSTSTSIDVSPSKISNGAYPQPSESNDNPNATPKTLRKDLSQLHLYIHNHNSTEKLKLFTCYIDKLFDFIKLVWQAPH